MAGPPLEVVTLRTKRGSALAACAAAACAAAVCAGGLALAAVGVASLRPSAAAEVGDVPDAPAPAPATATAPVAVGETERRVVQPTVAEPSRKTPKLAPPVRLELP
ncbi:MAG: hypothetical protein M3434_08730, partial [Gemmatimonadota bacterium]|nr:hypothetical protein [Gemmatimonadota bacterium]